MRINLLGKLSHGLNYILLILIFFFTAGVFFRLPAKYYNEILLPCGALIAAGLSFLVVRRIADICRLPKEERTFSAVLKKLSSLTIHLSAVLILAAWFLSSFFAHGAYLEGREGSVMRLTQSGFPFDIKIETVQADYYGDGAPRQYTTSFSILRDGKEAAGGSVTVNHPFSYGGAKIYQYGYSGDSAGAVTGLYVKTDPGVPWLYIAAVFVPVSAAFRILGMKRGDGQVEKC